jgi:hypothetical protein
MAGAQVHAAAYWSVHDTTNMGDDHYESNRRLAGCNPPPALPAQEGRHSPAYLSQ